MLDPASIVLKTNIIPHALKTIVDAVSSPSTIKSDIFILLKLPMLIGGVAWMEIILVEWSQSYLQAKNYSSI